MPSNLPSIQRVKFEDYKDAPPWFGQFLNTLNLFLNPTYDILNRGISPENIGCISTASFRYTDGVTQNFNFASPVTQVPSCVIVGNAYEAANTIKHPAGAVTIQWHFSKGKIYVDALLGLTPNVPYIISVLVA